MGKFTHKVKNTLTDNGYISNDVQEDVLVSDETGEEIHLGYNLAGFEIDSKVEAWGGETYWSDEENYLKAEL